MRFTCDSCSAKYTIADDKVRGKVVAVKCNRCGQRITVNGKSLAEPEPAYEESTRVANIADLDAALRASTEKSAAAPAPKPEIDDGWYAIIDGQQQGPLSADEFTGKVGKGKLTERTYVWRDGQGDWKRASEVAALAAAFAPKPAAPPPPPHPADPPAVSKPAGKGKNGATAAEKASAPPVDDDGEPATMMAPAIASAAAAAMGADESALGGDDFADKLGAKKPADDPFELGGEETVKKPAEKPKGGDLNQLFDGELDSEPTMSGKAVDLAAIAPGDLERHSAPPVPGAGDPFAVASGDPFAAVPDNPNVAKPEIGEQTRFFMKQAGVNRRNPPWKIAVAVFLLIGLPVAVLYGLSQLGIEPIQLTRIDEKTGEVVPTTLFGEGGFSSLRDKLLGKAPPPAAPKVAKADPPKPKAGDDKPLVEKPKVVAAAMSEADKARAQALYTSDELPGMHKGPKVRSDKLEKQAVDGASNLDSKLVAEVVGKNLKAFQGCVEQELRRNPSFKGGKVNITFSVGPSGTVTRAVIDRPDVEQSSVGACLKEKAKRVVFPSFEGDAVDIEAPLVLTSGG